MDNARTRQRLEMDWGKTENLTPFEAFQLFYKDVSKAPMSEEEEFLMGQVFERVMEEKE